jgi:hypothetical protein
VVDERRSMINREGMDREQIIEKLVMDGGISRHDAELRFVDDDLWVLPHELRFSYEGEEALRKLEHATSELWQLCRFTSDLESSFSDVTRMALWDAYERMAIARGRARERVARSASAAE